MASIYQADYQVLDCNNVECKEYIHMGSYCPGESWVCNKCCYLNFIESKNIFDAPKLLKNISTEYEMAIAISINNQFGQDIFISADGKDCSVIMTEKAKQYRKRKEAEHEISDTMRGVKGPWRFLAASDHPIHLKGKMGEDVRLAFQVAMDTLILNVYKVKRRQPKEQGEFVGYISTPPCSAMAMKTYGVFYRHRDNYLLKPIIKGPLFKEENMERLNPTKNADHKADWDHLPQSYKDWLSYFGSIIYDDQSFDFPSRGPNYPIIVYDNQVKIDM